MAGIKAVIVKVVSVTKFLGELDFTWSSCELNVVQIGGDRMLVVAFWRRGEG